MAEVRNLVDFDAYDARRGFRLADRYALTRSIRNTGVGQTYLADDTEAAKQVLVAIHAAPWADDPSRTRLFETRARALASLEHANIASLLDHGIIDGKCFAVLQRFEGDRLADKLVRKSRMSAEEVVPIVSQLLKALEYVHARGVLARCLDPAHVLLCSDGVHTNIVRVVGVGIDELMQNLTEPEEAALVGDADFASPEQLRGETATTQSDVFAVGRLMLAMLQGNPSASTLDLLRGSGRLPESLVDLIEACVRPVPAERPLDAVAMVEMLIDAVPNASMFRLPRITGSHSRLERRITPSPAQPSPPAASDSAETLPKPAPDLPHVAPSAKDVPERSRSRVLLWSGIGAALLVAAGGLVLSQNQPTVSNPPSEASSAASPATAVDVPAVGAANPSVPTSREAEDVIPREPVVHPESAVPVQTDESAHPSRPTRSEGSRRRSRARPDAKLDSARDSQPSDVPPPKAPSTSAEPKVESTKPKDDPFLTPTRRASETKSDLLPAKEGP